VLDKYIEDLKKNSKITINEALLKEQAPAAAKPETKDAKPEAKDAKPEAKDTSAKPAGTDNNPDISKKDTVPKSK